MKARVLMLVAAVALGGCYTSKEKVYPPGEGEQMSLKLGTYQCHGNTGKPYDTDISEVQDDDQYLYRYHAVGQAVPDVTLAFHAVSGDRYVVEITHPGSPAGLQMYIIVRVSGIFVDVLEFHPGYISAIAAQTGVTAMTSETGDLDLSGPQQGQKAFLQALAVETPSSVAVSCAPKS